jgi:hypothetical protein
MYRRLLLTVALLVPLLAVTPARAATGYNGAAAAAYADTYWSTYNTAWPNFAKKGGDCTNFVSQALYAGGISMRTDPPYSGSAAWFMTQSGRKTWSYSTSWVNAQDDSAFLEQNLAGVTVVASYYGVAPGQLVPDNASQGDVVLYDWNNDGVFDHESIVTASDGTTNADGTTNWDLVDAHTTNRYHAYWTLAGYNSSWATTRIVVLHIAPGTT